MKVKRFFREIFIQGINPMRYMMHRAFEEKKARIISPCVDLGGGNPQIQTYLDHIINEKGEKVIIADISPEADVYCNLEEPLPFENGKFKTVLLINVLPLIFDFNLVAKEVYRILESGGTAYIWTSFNANTHPHPNDYFRFTEQSLEKIFKQASFPEVETKSYGGLGLTIGAYMGQMTQKVKIISAIIYTFWFAINKIFNLIKPKENAKRWPMGHLAIAKKK